MDDMVHGECALTVSALDIFYSPKDWAADSHLIQTECKTRKKKKNPKPIIKQ